METSRFYCREVVRALLRCLGLETGVQQNSTSCPKKQDDHNHQHQGSTTDDYSDPPPDPTSTTVRGDDGVPVISFSTPKRPGTGSGRGPQIN
ncbi:hypothetical protein F3Y22_tig00112498pilonHSYRG00254 [Hibiscus syriacus]|uniref:Uncharacterized protein n=1 Tax=Hibiscus syriacus TaxID=106335 RepID=A0A6A2XAU5_HIBSY|nr:hypothetical protein F3Y22_tig00112498pilonHSYRG00254 [Hibiscus syriacus]